MRLKELQMNQSNGKNGKRVKRGAHGSFEYYLKWILISVWLMLKNGKNILRVTLVFHTFRKVGPNFARWYWWINLMVTITLRVRAVQKKYWLTNVRLNRHSWGGETRTNISHLFFLILAVHKKMEKPTISFYITLYNENVAVSNRLNRFSNLHFILISFDVYYYVDIVQFLNFIVRYHWIWTHTMWIKLSICISISSS